MNRISSLFFVGLLHLTSSFALGQWGRTNGPEGGYIALIFNDPGTSYVFAGGNGFYKSTNNGVTWIESNTGMGGNASPVAMVRSGSNLFTASLDKVYFSTDNGSSWTVRSSGLPQILSMGIIGNVLVVGTNVFGIYRSTNDGVSWTPATGLPPSNNIVQAFATIGTRLLAGLGGKGVWVSTDNGASWVQSSLGLGTTRSVNGLAVHGANVFAATSDSAVLVSTNQGANWTASGTGMNPRASVVGIGSNGTTLFASVTGAYSGIDSGTVYRSTDNGASWVSVKSGLYTSYQSAYRQFIGFGTGGKVFAGSSAGIYATTNNGTNWSPSNSGLRNANALAMTVSGTTLYAGHAGGIARTQDEGATWVQVNNGLPPGSGVMGMAAHGSYVLAAAGYVYRSSNNGANWEQMNNGITVPAIGALSTSSSSIYAGSALGGVYVSTNDGANWTGPGTGLPGFGGVNTIFVDGTTLWAGIASNGVYRSTDNGATWTASNNGLPAFSRNVSGITRSGSTLFAGLTSSTTGSVYISTDNGTNWTSASNGIPSGSYCFTLYSVGQFVFAGFNYSGTGVASGIYRTSNNGGNWAAVNTGLPDPCSINVIAVMGANMYGSFLGVWKRPLSQVTDVREIGNEIPERVSLEQNYPNPFNPNTVIRFRVTAYSHVKLGIFDLLGREVTTLVNEEMQLGSYEVTFDASSLSSGTYLYRLQARNYAETKKMLLMK